MRIISSFMIMRWTGCGAHCPRRASAGRKPRAARAAVFCGNFSTHCESGTNYVTGRPGSPLDFIAFHAKGSPSYTSNHVRMGIRNQLRTINDACAVVAAFPQYRQTPIIIGESDPDSCAACTGPQNRLSQHHPLRQLHRRQLRPRIRTWRIIAGVNLEGALTWAFEFEDEPIFAGHRVLATGGVDLPVLNVFRMFNRLSGQRIQAESDGAVPLETILAQGVRAQPDVAAFASLDARKLCVLVWHYHDDDVPGPSAEISLDFSGLPLRRGPSAIATFYYRPKRTATPLPFGRAWATPPHPDPEQYAQLGYRRPVSRTWAAWRH